MTFVVWMRTYASWSTFKDNKNAYLNCFRCFSCLKHANSTKESCTSNSSNLLNRWLRWRIRIWTPKKKSSSWVSHWARLCWCAFTWGIAWAFLPRTLWSTMVTDRLYLTKSKSKCEYSIDYFHCRTISLYIAKKSDYTTIDQGILKLEANLKRI
jgi:hypothetical protein